MQKILKLRPSFKATIWGGEKIGKIYHNDLKGIGEAWVISANDGYESIIENGELKNKTLSEVYKNNREIFGNIETDRFPLLVKIIDANKDLSIQVHPDDNYAYMNENGSLGKSECWYILDADKEADIIVGHNAKTMEELKELIKDNSYDKLLNIMPIKKEDFFNIPAGTVHAIRANTLLLEIQQNSDVTYRLYDYGRLENGSPRELHIDKSLDVIKVPDKFVKSESVRENIDEYEVEHLLKGEYFSVDKYNLIGEMKLKQEYPFMTLSVIGGEGEIEGIKCREYDNFILTNDAYEVKISGNIKFITAHI